MSVALAQKLKTTVMKNDSVPGIDSSPDLTSSDYSEGEHDVKIKRGKSSENLCLNIEENIKTQDGVSYY